MEWDRVSLIAVAAYLWAGVCVVCAWEVSNASNEAILGCRLFERGTWGNRITVALAWWLTPAAFWYARGKASDPSFPRVAREARRYVLAVLVPAETAARRAEESRRVKDRAEIRDELVAEEAAERREAERGREWETVLETPPGGRPGCDYEAGGGGVA